MSAPEKFESGAPVPVVHDPDANVSIDAEEFARQEERRVVEQAWRDQEVYARSVAELKKEVGWRESRRARAIAVLVLLAAVAIGVFLYNQQLAQERASRAEALRIAAASLARQEEERRAEPAPVAQAAEPAQVPAQV